MSPGPAGAAAARQKQHADTAERKECAYGVVFVFRMNLLSSCACLRILILGFPLQVIYS